MKSTIVTALSGAALLALSTAASAAIVSYSADVTQIAAPAGVTNGSPGSNSDYLVFDELQGVTLASNLTTDQGVDILAGTRVDSHMVFLNRQTGSSFLGPDASVTFSGMILGTMSDIHGSVHLVPSDFLGGTTTYTNFNNRGLELSGQNADTYSIAASTLNMQFNVTQPGDWMRVVTVAQVPVPAGALLLPMGIFALGAVRRKKRKEK